MKAIGKMKNLLTAFLLFIATVASAQFELKEGDLLFQDLDCGAYCEAIEKVTQGVNGAHLSHVGIAFKEEGDWLVFEARSAGVVKTPLAEFLKRSKDADGNAKVLVGRVEHPDVPVRLVLRKFNRYEDKPYDAVYDLGNDRYYCSELVYKLFTDSDGSPVFRISSMTFKDPETGELFPAWNNYFDEQGVPVPEGKPGLNPGSISRSPYVKIVHHYGIPDGYTP